MFTGIVEETGAIEGIHEMPGNSSVDPRARPRAGRESRR
jgi:hypothetical protein